MKENRETHKATQQEFTRISLNPIEPLWSDKGSALCTFNNEEVEHSRERHAPVNPTEPTVIAFVVEGEEESQEVLYKEPREERDHNRHQNGHDHRQRFTRI